MAIKKIKVGDTTYDIQDANAYVKPSGGIPSSDMSEAVQTSLGKADAAEDKSNKVTAISGSSTDTEYPSAKAVNDAIKAGSVSEALRLKTEVKANQSFVFRKSAKTIGTDSLTIDKIKGRTLAWNQWVKMPQAGSANGWTDLRNPVYNSDGSFTITPVTDWDGGIYEAYTGIVGHKYLLSFSLQCSDIMRVYFGGTYATTGTYTNKTHIATILTSTEANHIALLGTANVPATFWDFQLFDLTLMFGAGNEPATVAEFEALYPLAYYPYNAGELISNDAKALETVGFNLWDEEWGNWAWDINAGSKNTSASDRIASKNYIRVLPNTAYYFNVNMAATEERDILYYDNDYNYLGYKTDRTANSFTTPSNAAYIQFSLQPAYGTTYNHDICINLSNPAKNGTYEPYKRVVLPLNLSDREVISPNIWDEEFEVGYWDTTNGQFVSDSNWKCSKNRISVQEGKTYHNTKDGDYFNACYYDKNGTFVSGTNIGANADFTIPSGVAYMHFYGQSNMTYCCINESNPGHNGNYYPHGTFKPFPDGMRGAGAAFDYAGRNKVDRVMKEVDMGNLEWYYQGNGRFIARGSSVPGIISSLSRVLVCSKYAFSDQLDSSSVPDKSIANNSWFEAADVLVKDTDYTDAETFTAAMSGVKLIYEQAVPEEFDLVTPLPLSTFSGTTERRLPEDTENDVMAPFECDMTYGTNNEQMLDTMNAKAVSVSKDTLLTLLNALKSGSVIADYSITWGDNGPELVITPNS